jgi:hypothetical protein
MDTSTKERFTSKDLWLRLLLMLGFGIISYVVACLVWLIAVIQIMLAFIMGKPNQNLLNLGEGLSKYMYSLFRFLTYNTEEKPFPFTSWSGK